MKQEENELDFLPNKEKIFLIFLLFWQVDELIGIFKQAIRKEIFYAA